MYNFFFKQLTNYLSSESTTSNYVVSRFLYDSVPDGRTVWR